MFNFQALADEAKSCLYVNVNEQELIEGDSCISFEKWIKRPNDSDAAIAKKIAMTAAYDQDNLSYLYSEYGLFYFNKSGKLRRTINYDNGPDYFESGLARTQWNEKIGFFNKALEIVIAPQFDFAFPFKNGVSLVCNGCVKKRDGEHSFMVKGLWGFIDLSGNVIVPIKHTQNLALDELNKVLQE